MPRSHALQGAVRAGLALFLLVPSACLHYRDVKRDDRRQPTVNTGVGGTILYPGQAPPPLVWPPPGSVVAPPCSSASGSSSGSSSGATSGGAAGAGPSGAAPGAPAPASSGPVLIGGADLDLERHQEIHDEPLWTHPVWFPFAVVLYPVRKVRDWMRRDPDPQAKQAAAAVPPPVTRQDVQAAHERAQLEALRRQLETQGAAPAPPAPAPPRSAAPVAPGPGRFGRPSSIAEELAALRGQTGAVPRSEPAAEIYRPAPPLPRPSAPPAGLADRVHDRNGDGRPDHWEHREAGRLVREVFDDDGDGAPDRSVYYDAGTGERLRVEEDIDRDGRTDSWAYFEHDRLVRRRADTDADGAVDHWTFFRGETILRDERDTNGDGFRDRVDLYEAGRLVRRDEDRNGDGRGDRVTRFDASGAPSELEEDTDGDGRVDVRSYYADGKLVRRELLTELAAREALEPLPLLDGSPAPDETAPTP